MKTRRLPIALALAAMPCLLHAQESRLSSVVVSAPKIDDQTLTASQQGEASLAPLRASTSDTAGMLRDVPGVSLYGAGGVSSLPAIHGMADDRVRVKVDGMDLVASCPNHMNPALSYVDPSNVGALKVYAGITPVSVGGDSIGGTIIAETPAPEFAAAGQGHLLKGQAGAFYRSNNSAYGANVAATFATETINLSYSGATAKADNYTAGGNFRTSTVTGRSGHTLALDEVGSTAYKTENHTLGLAVKSGNHLVEAKLGYQHIPYELYPNQRMDMLDNTQNRLNLRYLGKFDWGGLEARAYHEKVRHHMDFGDDKRFWYGNGAPPSGSGGAAAQNGTPCSPISNTCAAGMPMDTKSRTTGASVTASIDLSSDHMLRVGGEYQEYHLDDWWPASGAMMLPNTFWNINAGERDRTAVFVEWEGRFSQQWLALVGARYEHVKSDTGPVQAYNNATAPAPTLVPAFNNRNRERTDNNLDLTALARYTPSATSDIEFGFARKVRSPNLYERYSWFSRGMEMLMVNWVGDGNGYIGNIDLKPEKAHTVSATLDLHSADRAWEFKVTPYYTRVTDYIDAVRCPTSLAGFCTAANLTDTNKFVYLQFANQSARLYGLDLSGHMPLAKTGLGELGLKGLLNYTNGKNRTTGDELYNIMPLNAKVALTHALGGWDNAFEVVMVKAKDKVSDVRNEIKTPGYSLVNLRASYSWKQARVDFGVENLFDKLYYQPLGGAYNGQGTTMTTAGASSPVWGVQVPGIGRSLYAGLTLKF